MPKLNLALMAVLSVAVIAIGVVMALGSTATPPDVEARLARLIRQLGDSDPDVRRDAESSLKQYGSSALPVLHKTAELPDAVLAGRARQIIAQIKATPTAAPEETDSRLAASGAPAEVKIALHLPQTRIRFGERPRLYGRLENGLPQPILVGRYSADAATYYGRFAFFEITEPGGRVHTLPVDALPPEAKPRLEIEAVASGQSASLFEGMAEIHRPAYESFAAPGCYSIRLVYDATEGSAYRDALAKNGDAAGMPLATGRIISNTVTVTVE